MKENKMADDFKNTALFSPSEKQEHEQRLREEYASVPNDFKSTVPFSPEEKHAHDKIMKEKAGILAATVGSRREPSMWTLCQKGDFVLRERSHQKHVFDDYIQTNIKFASAIIPRSYVLDRIDRYSAESSYLDLRLAEGSILGVSDTSLLSPPVRIFRPGPCINAEILRHLPIGTPLCCDIEYKIGNDRWKEEGSYFHKAGFLGEKTLEDFKLHADAGLKVILHKYSFNDFNDGALPQHAQEWLGGSLVGYGKISLRHLVPTDIL